MRLVTMLVLVIAVLAGCAPVKDAEQMPLPASIRKADTVMLVNWKMDGTGYNMPATVDSKNERLRPFFPVDFDGHVIVSNSGIVAVRNESRLLVAKGHTDVKGNIFLDCEPTVVSHRPEETDAQAIARTYQEIVWPKSQILKPGDKVFIVFWKKGEGTRSIEGIVDQSGIRITLDPEKLAERPNSFNWGACPRPGFIKIKSNYRGLRLHDRLFSLGMVKVNSDRSLFFDTRQIEVVNPRSVYFNQDLESHQIAKKVLGQG